MGMSEYLRGEKQIDPNRNRGKSVNSLVDKYIAEVLSNNWFF